MAAGEYSERVVRYVLTKAKDTFGGAVEEYEAGGSFWSAADAPTGSDESVMKGDRNTERMSFRLRQRVAIAPGDRLYWVNAGQFWQVESKSSTDAETTCQCYLVDGVKR